MTVARDFDGLVAARGRGQDLAATLREMMPERRWRHCEAASRLASALASRYGHPAPGMVGRTALLHDVARVLDIAALKGIADWYGWDPDPDEWKAGADLLHGPAGAAVVSAWGLPREGGAAIRYHVTGRPDPTLADKVVAAADACEETRPYEWAPAAREALGVSLELAFAFWITLKAEKVEAAGLAPHPRSRLTLASLAAPLAAEARRLVTPYV